MRLYICKGTATPYRGHPRLESRQSSYGSRRGRDRFDTGGYIRPLIIFEIFLQIKGPYLAITGAVVMEGEQFPFRVVRTFLLSNLAILVFVDVVTEVKLREGR